MGFNHPGGMTSVMPLAVKLALKDKDVTLGINARQERKAHRRGFLGFCFSGFSDSMHIKIRGNSPKISPNFPNLTFPTQNFCSILNQFVEFLRRAKRV